MFKIFEYICNNENCEKDLEPVELLVDDSLIDEQKCELCKSKLSRILSATKGYVWGTDNPVRQ